MGTRPCTMNNEETESDSLLILLPTYNDYLLFPSIQVLLPDSDSIPRLLPAFHYSKAGETLVMWARKDGRKGLVLHGRRGLRTTRKVKVPGSLPYIPGERMSWTWSVKHVVSWTIHKLVPVHSDKLFAVFNYIIWHEERHEVLSGFRERKLGLGKSSAQTYACGLWHKEISCCQILSTCDMRATLLWN